MKSILARTGVSLLYLVCVSCTYVTSGDNFCMRFPHCDRDAKVVDTLDDALWPFPRRPAPALYSSVRILAHDELRQAFAPMRNTFPKNRSCRFFTVISVLSHLVLSSAARSDRL